MVRSEKIDFVNQISDKLKQSQSVILADFRGLTVAQITDLRVQLRKSGVELKVIKNRLGKRALVNAGCESLDQFLTGNTAWAFGLKDPVEPAKILARYSKDNEKLVLKGGLLEGKRINSAGVAQLASMPGRKELLSKLAGDFKQPATKLAIVMEAGIVKMARAFQALAKKLEEAGGAA